MPDPFKATVFGIQQRLYSISDVRKAQVALRVPPGDLELFESRRGRTLVADDRDINYVECFPQLLDSLERPSGVRRVTSGLFPQCMQPSLVDDIREARPLQEPGVTIEPVDRGGRIARRDRVDEIQCWMAPNQVPRRKHSSNDPHTGNSSFTG